MSSRSGELRILLRRYGIDAVFDKPAAERRVDRAQWIADHVRETDHALVIASAAYRKGTEGRAEPDEGRGLQWEARLIRDAFYADQRGLEKFVPVVLPGQLVTGVRDFRVPATTTVYDTTDFTG